MTRTSIVSRWATDDTLVKKAVEEDLKHNPLQKTSNSLQKIDSIAKKVYGKKTEDVLEDNNDDYEDVSESDGDDNEVEEVEEEEIIPIPKSKLSKEAQRLFPVENFKGNKENNNRKLKHTIPTGPKNVKSKSTEKHPNKNMDIDLNIISPPPSREKADKKKAVHVKNINCTDEPSLGDKKNVKKTDLSSRWASKTIDNKTPMSPPNSSGNEKETADKHKVTEKNKLRKIRDLERERIRKAKSGKGLEWDDGKRVGNEKERHIKMPHKDKYEEERNRNKNRNKNGNSNANALKNGKNNNPSYRPVRETHKHFAFNDVNDANKKTEDDYDDEEEIEVDNAAIEAVMAKLKDASIDWTADDNDYF